MNFISRLLNRLPYQAEFSMDEIIPALEKKISCMRNEDYSIDFFITNTDDSKTLEVRYVAFPKQESYTKALFRYKNSICRYTKIDEKHEFFEQLPLSARFDDILDIQDNNKAFLIAKENIPVTTVMAYLIMPHEERKLLLDNFFCYNEELDELDDTITCFAKKKIPQK